MILEDDLRGNGQLLFVFNDFHLTVNRKGIAVWVLDKEILALDSVHVYIAKHIIGLFDLKLDEMLVLKGLFVHLPRKSLKILTDLVIDLLHVVDGYNFGLALNFVFLLARLYLVPSKVVYFIGTHFHHKFEV